MKFESLGSSRENVHYVAIKVEKWEKWKSRKKGNDLTKVYMEGPYIFCKKLWGCCGHNN